MSHIVVAVQSSVPKIHDFNYGQPLENNSNKCGTMKHSAEMTICNIVAHSALPAPALFVFSH